MSNFNVAELDRLIRHLRSKTQSHSETIGGWRREFKSDDCLAADYLETLRSELPHWQMPPEEESSR